MMPTEDAMSKKHRAPVARQTQSSFRDVTRSGTGPESIITMVVMDSGLALRAPRNDG